MILPLSEGLSKRSRSQAVWFDPSSQAYHPKKKMIKMDKSREAAWLNGPRNNMHSSKIKKTNKIKHKLVRNTKPTIKRISRRPAGNHGALKKGLYGHFVMNELGRLEQTDSPPPKLSILNIHYPRPLSVATAENSNRVIYEPLGPTLKIAVNKKINSKPSRNTVNSIGLLSPDSCDRLAYSFLIDSPLIMKSDVKTPVSIVSPLKVFFYVAQNL